MYMNTKMTMDINMYMCIYVYSYTGNALVSSIICAFRAEEKKI